jgi:hypothetical protein
MGEASIGPDEVDMADWRQKVDAMMDAGGVMSLTFVRPTSIVGLMPAAMAGDPEAGMLITMVERCLKKINKARTEEAAFAGCQLCDAPFWIEALPHLFVVATGYQPGEEQHEHSGFMSGICTACWRKHGKGLQTVVIGDLGERLQTEIRVLPPVHEGVGHA